MIMIYLMKQWQESEDIIDTTVPMEVDSSSSDNLTPEPAEEIKPKKKTIKDKSSTLPVKLMFEPEVTTRELNNKKDADDDDLSGPIHMGETALLKQWLATMASARIQSGKYTGSSYEEIFTKDREYANYLCGNTICVDQSRRTWRTISSARRRMSSE